MIDMVPSVAFATPPDMQASITSTRPRSRRARSRTPVGETVLLKGRITLVATPEGLVYGNDAGSSWAATAGAGDVLTGIAGSLLAAGLEPVVAGACAARVHALAARQASGGAPVGASALLAAVHPVIGELRGA